MNKCYKCKDKIRDNDIFYWKCNNCNHVFKVTFSNLKKIISKKNDNKKSILRCPKCKKPLDDGNENIAYKCLSCKTVIKCSLEDMSKKTTISDFIYRYRKIIVAIDLMVLVVTLGFSYIPNLLTSPYEYMEEGKFRSAYKRADKDHKNNVLFENLICNICLDAVDKLKNPDSFKLKGIWYDENDKEDIVLNISGENGYGGSSSNYWIYTFDDKNNRYEFLNAIDEMKKESINIFDDTDEITEKFVNNLSRDIISNVCTDSNKIDRQYVKIVNTLHENDLLYDVRLLEETKSLYPKTDNGGQSTT